MSKNTKGCTIASPYKNVFIYLLRLSLMVAVALLLPTKTLAQTPPQATYYVDPVNGNDANSGTGLGSAFQTIAKARDAVRTVNTNMTGDIYVYLRGGTHWLTSTLSLTDVDSGTNGYNIIYSAYNGEKPVISGGKKITGWTLHNSCENNCQTIYKAYAGNIETRQLFVNGVRATRARSTVVPSPLTFVKATGYSANGNIFANNAKPMDQWENLTDLEFVYKNEWTAPRVGVSSISNDGTATTIAMKQPAWGWATNKGLTSVGGTYNTSGRPWFVENAYELLDAEGEWYLNRATDTIYYKPKMNEDISTATIIAPVLDELIRVQGTDLDHKAHNLQFKGITFSYTTDVEANSNKGHVDSQNDITFDTDNENDANGTLISYYINISAAVNLKYANAIQFERDVFEHLGNTGLNMYAGSQDNLVTGSIFLDISGKGVHVGDYKNYLVEDSENYGNTSDSRAILRNNDVINNYFTNIGVEYYSSAAISAVFPQDMDVLHNEVANVPYSGMHIGYGHNLIPQNVHKNTHIEYNYVHEALTTLSDGGLIYVLGYTGGDASNIGTISNNFVQNQYNQTGALYTDNYSSWWNVSNNVVINAPRYFMSNVASNVTVTNTYTNTGSITTNGGGVAVSGTTVVTDGNWPVAAQTIMANAGLESAYQDIKSSAVLPPNSKFYENFDLMNGGDSPTDWTINNAGGDGTVTVDDSSFAVDQNKSMKLTKTSATSGLDLVSSHSFVPLISGAAEVKAKAGQTNVLAVPVALKSGSTSAIEIAFNSNGQISYKNAGGTWIDIQAYTAGTWYNFKIEFDTEMDTYTLYIDSVQKLSTVAFAMASDAIDGVASQIKAANTGTINVDNVNVTEFPLITASSQYSSAYVPNNAFDGNVGLNGVGEWASSGELNPWIQINWAQGKTISNIVLYDRVLTSGDANSGTLTFSDGSSIDVTGIPKGGAPKFVQFPSKTVTWVKFQVTGGSGANVGLSEMKVNDLYNVAPNATLTASSQYSATYAISKATDGIVLASGTEWASYQELNPWIQLDWTTSQTISKITFYDRFNTADWTPGGTLTFSDGSTLTVSGIPNNGQGKTITFPSKTVTWVKFQVAGGSGGNAGLTEIEVYAVESPPVVAASSQYSSAYVPNNAFDGNVGLNGVGEWASSGELNPWIQISWEQVKRINNIVLYDRITTDNANSGTLTFSDGSSITVTGIPANGSPKLVQFPSKTVTWVKFQVTGGSGANVGLSEMKVNDLYNVAPNATVTASSQYSASYAISKATDGIILASGTEWASYHELNPWIQLDWTTSQTVSKITFYDRFNTADWTPGGTLTFSDGSTLTVSGIPNNGQGRTITFPSKTVTWVKFQVAGGSGGNAGLTEIEVF